MENNLKLPCIITAYLDLSDIIKSKTPSVYLNYFSNFLELKNNIILFYDEKIETELNELIEIKNKKNISLIKINRNFLEKNIHGWKHLKNSNRILNSDYFNNIKKRRPCQGTTPEVNCVEYNLINYSKIDFINYIIDNDLSNHQYYAWLDFGGVREKTWMAEDLTYNPIECFVDDNALHMLAYPEILSRWKMPTDWNHEFLYFWKKIAGSLIFSHRKNFKTIQEKFHKECEIMLSHNLIDHDEPVWLMLKFRFPELIKIYKFESHMPGLKVKKPSEGLMIF